MNVGLYWSHVRRMPERVARLTAMAAELQESVSALVHAVGNTFSAPHLATVTILCEAFSYERDGEAVWVPSVVGAECWLHRGERGEVNIIPERTLRKFRWFVSGDPEIVVTAFVVGNEVAESCSAFAGKFGDAQMQCSVGSRLRIALERKAVRS